MWWKILQALIIGIVVGLALNAGLSILLGSDSASLFGVCDGRCSGHF